jgi:hypothetical protein
MSHKPGHLQFDNSAAAKQKPKTPGAIEFGAASAQPAKVPPPSAQRTPAAVFSEGGGDIAPAMAHVRTAFADLARAHEHSLERKIRQLAPWKHDVVGAWGSRALQENAAVTTQTARVINSFAEYRINELVEKATVMAQRGGSGLLNRFFLRGKVISFKPKLAVARSQLEALTRECSAHIASLDELGVRLRVDLAALSSSWEALPRPKDHELESAVHSRRVLLQQSIHQAELTALQLQELKQQIAAQTAQVEQLLMITIPAFEMADAAK